MKPLRSESYFKALQEASAANRVAREGATISGGGEPPMPPTDYYTKPEMDAKLDALGSRTDAKIDTRYNALELKIDTRYNALDAKIDVTAAKLDSKIDLATAHTDAKIDAAVAKFELALEKALWPIGERLAGLERTNTIIVGTVLAAAILGGLGWLASHAH